MPRALQPIPSRGASGSFGAFPFETAARVVLYLLIVLLPLALWHGTPTATGIKLILIRLFVPFAALLCVVSFARRMSLPRLPAMLMAAVAIYAAYQAFSLIVFTYATSTAFIDTIMGPLTFLLVAVLTDTHTRITRLIVLWECAVIVVAAYFLLQRAGYDFVTWQQTEAIPVGATFANRNHLMYYLTGAYPLALWLALGRKGWLPGVGWVALVLSVLCIVVGGSRAALGTVALSVPAYLFFWRPQSSSPLAKRWLFAFGVTAVALLVLAGAVAIRAALKLEPYALTERTGFRLDMWNSALLLARKYPWLGCGIGAFRCFYPDFRTSALKLSHGPATPLTHCHNEYLEILGEGGIVGLLLFVALAVCIVRAGWRRVRKADTGCVLPFLACMSVAGMLVFGGVSVAPRHLYCSVILWISLALFYNSAQSGHCCTRITGKNRLAALAGAVTVGGALVWLSVWSLRSFVSDVYLKRALDMAPSKALRPLALEQLDRALIVRRENVGALYQKAYLYNIQNAFDSALVYYDRVQDYDPHFQNIHFNKGMIHYRRENYTQAVEELEASFRIYSKYEPGLLALAEAYYYTWQFDKSITMCERLLRFYPNNTKAAFLKQYVEKKMAPSQVREKDI